MSMSTGIAILLVMVGLIGGILLILHGKKILNFNKECSDDKECNGYFYGSIPFIFGFIMLAVVVKVYSSGSDSLDSGININTSRYRSPMPQYPRSRQRKLYDPY